MTGVQTCALPICRVRGSNGSRRSFPSNASPWFRLRLCPNGAFPDGAPGLASAAGAAIDAMSMRTVVGCLSGDDTVIVVMRDINAAATFCGEIKNLLN